MMVPSPKLPISTSPAIVPNPDGATAIPHGANSPFPFGTSIGVNKLVPCAGEIVAVNERLVSEPELVNNDCYGEGWMLKVKLTSPAELNQALTAEDYKKFIVE